MTEATFVSGLMEKAKAAFRGAVVIKHADRYTAHIPDVQVLWLDRSNWAEVKYLRKGRRLKDIVEIGQCVFGHELSQTCGGRAYVAVYADVPFKQTQVWRPQVLAQHLWPKVVGGTPVNGHCLLPEEIALGKFSLFRLLLEHGMIWVEGHNHDLPLRVMHDGMAARG
jgi:hypothetical protein